MTAIEYIRNALAGYDPGLRPGHEAHRAAVALVLHETPAGLQILFIRRTARKGDPWSGHIAFPGGRIEAGDAGPQHTAERETREELGLELRSEEYLGRLDDLAAYSHSIRVSGFVYHIIHPDPLTLSAEVEMAFWTPVRDLSDATRHTTYRVAGDEERLVPAIDLLGPGQPVLWGLTYRFTAQLLKLMGITLP